MSALSVRHNIPADRFEADVTGGTAIVSYKKDGDAITFLHTVVPKEASGHGIAQTMVTEALQYAREQKLRVIPVCPYVASFVQRHREYDDILDPQYRQA